jgi:hypothetical protein
MVIPQLPSIVVIDVAVSLSQTVQPQTSLVEPNRNAGTAPRSGAEKAIAGKLVGNAVTGAG